MSLKPRSLRFYLSASFLVHLALIVFGLKFSVERSGNTVLKKLNMNLVYSSQKVMNVNPSEPVMSKKISSTAAPQESVQTEVVKSETQVQAAEGVLSGPEVADVKYKYFSEIAHTIHRHKQYPRKAYSLNQQGTVVVRLKVGKEGNILDLMVVEACPFESLNHATLDTISSIEKFPPIPKELGMEEITFRIPIEYKINL